MNAGLMDQFFAPVSTDLIDTLVGEYRAQRIKIEQVQIAMENHGLGSVMQYFIQGNLSEHGNRSVPDVTTLLKIDGAIKALNSAYWDRALRMTDVLDVMPQARRDEWYKQIREMKTPEFTDESVRATLSDMLTSRAKFLAERVDGIFRALSHEHLTNRPEGFGKRMILNNVLSEYGTWGTTQQGHINDLRCVIAKFMGRDEPHYSATTEAVKAARRQTGEWFTLDGGALKLRVYMKGTGHLELHPDMAWRLNAILASLYPTAIPEQHRRPPARKAKDVPLMEKPLPFAVLGILAGMRDGVRHEQTGDYRNPIKYVPVRNSLASHYGSTEKHAAKQAAEVLAAIGGTFSDGLWRFDYPPRPVIDLIVTSGCIPDQKSHQFYPTPERLAVIAVGLAEIGEQDVCLEPSAGTGGLAEYMPTARTTCVEVSDLHCAVLKAKGFRVENADFLAVKRPHISPDRIVMNPPFDQGRWRAHLEHAAGLLSAGGRLVAILPEGAKNKADLLPGMKLQWHGPYANEFAGTSIAVVILVVDA